MFCLLLILLSGRTFDVIAYESALAAQAGHVRKAAELQWEAAQARPEDVDLAFYAATMFAGSGDSDSAMKALTLAAANGLADVRRVVENPDLETLRARADWKLLVDLVAANDARVARTVSHPELRAELLAMWSADQTARSMIGKKKQELDVAWEDPALAPWYRAVEETDATNTRRFREIFAANGWPSISLAGRDGAYAAWALVQHSDDVPFQETCLAAMKKALDRGDLDPHQYANLFDRVRRNRYEKQRYGMATRGAELYPVEDEARLAERRRALGLEPISVHAHMHGFRYQPLTVAETRARDRKARADATAKIRESRAALARRDVTEARKLVSAALATASLTTDEIYDAARRFERAGAADMAARLLRIVRNRGRGRDR